MPAAAPHRTSHWRRTLQLALTFFAVSVMSAGCGMESERSDDGRRAGTASPGEWRESYGGPDAESWAVATTGAQWRSLWQRVGKDPPMALPAGQVGAGIFLGTRNTGGFGIAIESQETVGGAHLIRYHEVVPTGIVTMAITTPYLVWVFPDPGVAITIEKVAP